MIAHRKGSVDLGEPMSYEVVKYSLAITIRKITTQDHELYLILLEQIQFGSPTTVRVNITDHANPDILGGVECRYYPSWVFIGNTNTTTCMGSRWTYWWHDTA